MGKFCHPHGITLDTRVLMIPAYPENCSLYKLRELRIDTALHRLCCQPRVEYGITRKISLGVIGSLKMDGQKSIWLRQFELLSRDHFDLRFVPWRSRNYIMLYVTWQRHPLRCTVGTFASQPTRRTMANLWKVSSGAWQ